MCAAQNVDFGNVIVHEHQTRVPDAIDTRSTREMPEWMYFRGRHITDNWPTLPPPLEIANPLGWNAGVDPCQPVRDYIFPGDLLFVYDDDPTPSGLVDAVKRDLHIHSLIDDGYKLCVTQCEQRFDPVNPRLSDVPDSWWTPAPNERGGYQYRTNTLIFGKHVETLLDGCAGSNNITEEMVVGMINNVP